MIREVERGSICVCRYPTRAPKMPIPGGHQMECLYRPVNEIHQRTIAGGTGRSFAIIAFLQNLDQNGQVLLLAGANAEGTEAASSFVSDVPGSRLRCTVAESPLRSRISSFFFKWRPWPALRTASAWLTATRCPARPVKTARALTSCRMQSAGLGRRSLQQNHSWRVSKLLQLSGCSNQENPPENCSRGLQ